jgi:hypothetical protein
VRRSSTTIEIHSNGLKYHAFLKLRPALRIRWLRNEIL